MDITGESNNFEFFPVDKSICFNPTYYFCYVLQSTTQTTASQFADFTIVKRLEEVKCGGKTPKS